MKTSIPELPPAFVGPEYQHVLTAIEFGTPSQQRTAVSHYFEDLEQIFGEVANRARGGRQNRQEADYLTRVRFGAVEKAGSMLFEVVRRGWLESYPDLEWLDELVRRQVEAGQAGPVIRNPGTLWMSVSGSSYMKLSDGEIVTPRPMYRTAFEDPELDNMLWLPEDQVPTGGIEEALAQDWLRSGAICRRLADAVRHTRFSDPEPQGDDCGGRSDPSQNSAISDRLGAHKKINKAKRPALNALMLHLMQKHGEETCVAWTIAEWQFALIGGWGKAPSRSSIHSTLTWKLLISLRRQNGAELREHQTEKDERGKRNSTAF